MLSTSRQVIASTRPASTPALPRAARNVRKQRRCMKIQAYLEPTAAYAITQQAVAYAAVLGGDLYVERRSKLPPQLPVALAGVGGTVAAVAILNSGQESLTGVGLITGLLTAGALLAYHIKRTVDIVDEDADWPGPKVAPGTMALISFFELFVFIQGISAEL